jgi:hypothetical protein
MGSGGSSLMTKNSSHVPQGEEVLFRFIDKYAILLFSFNVMLICYEIKVIHINVNVKKLMI